ncbi:transposase [Streptomyces sp. NPDC057217]|uniref:transposase n=1 Tax=Streptomyces sp. NPDC057217 TaxID=3346054 RepID=UPI00362DDA11
MGADWRHARRPRPRPGVRTGLDGRDELLQAGQEIAAALQLPRLPGRKGEPKGFTRRNHRDLITRAHIQLGGPIVLVWDNLRAHLMPQMRAFIEANADWLTVFQLSSYAPDLNPQEGI